MDIHVHIERLVIDAPLLAADQRPAMQAAVTRELGRLLAAGDLPPAGGIPRLDAGTISSASPDADTFGNQVAEAVHHGLSR
jgi:hypothetical protein